MNATIIDAPAARAARESRYTDLGATVHIGAVPAEVSARLLDLYGELMSTLDWIEAFERKRPTGVCLLERPEHVVLFADEGDTVAILNEAFACEARDADRICAALFRALPHAQRIRLQATLSPADLALPHRVVSRVSHMVIDLPGSTDEYYCSLGKKTRKNIRWYQNKLRRAHPDVRVDVIEPGARSRELLDRLIAWKIARFRRQARVTYWETDSTLPARVADLAERCGQMRLTYVSGRLAAIDLCYRTGETAYISEGAHDPAFDEFSLGFLTFYWFIVAAIESGARRVNTHEGTVESKTVFGAEPLQLTTLSIFRTKAARLRYTREAVQVARRRVGIAYERWRKALSTRLKTYAAGRSLIALVRRYRRHRR